jgi:hypothetical protein
MYRRMVEWIRRRDQSGAVYLCMESEDVHRKVFGRPESAPLDLGRYMDDSVLVTIQGM